MTTTVRVINDGPGVLKLQRQYTPDACIILMPGEITSKHEVLCAGDLIEITEIAHSKEEYLAKEPKA